MSEQHASRTDALTSWTSEWSGLRVAVLGLGLAGFAAADTLTELGAEVLVVAERAEQERIDLARVIGADVLVRESFTDAPAELVEFDPELVVVSPGFRPVHPLVVWATSRGLPVWGDVELAWRVRDKVVRDDGSPADWIVVTGTLGKTTTSTLTALMLQDAGTRVAPCGANGVPVLDAVRDPQGFDVLVVELSSHQLHYLGDISPLSSVCLNIADDEGDWHGSVAEYVAAKAKVYTNTRVACVYNKSDRLTEGMVRDAEVIDGARAIGFGLGVPGPSDFGIVDGILCDRAFLDDRHSTALELATIDDLVARGLSLPHLVADVLAAAALARSAGAPPSVVRSAIARFDL